MRKTMTDDDYDYIYPELTGFYVENVPCEPVKFPENCPCCGAIYAAKREDQELHARCRYACGGKYVPKPQIQNHTRIWWGSCPKAKRAIALGLRPDTPNRILRDASLDAGRDPDWKKEKKGEEEEA